MKIPSELQKLVSRKLGVSLIFAYLFFEAGELFLSAMVVVAYLFAQAFVDAEKAGK